jgi:hypothetical protein
LISFLFIFKNTKINDLFKGQPLILYMLELIPEDEYEDLFDLFNNINVNLKNNEKSVFKYILDSPMGFDKLQRNIIIDYNELIKDLTSSKSDIEYIYKLKEKLDDFHDKVETQYDEDLFSLLTVVFMISVEILKIEKKENYLVKILGEVQNEKLFNGKIDIKYWIKKIISF